MLFEEKVKTDLLAGLQVLYPNRFNADDIQLQATRKEFKGDITLVVFGLAKKAGVNPDAFGNELSSWLTVHSGLVSSCNVIKGFLNIEIRNSVWLNFYHEHTAHTERSSHQSNQIEELHPVLVEYSSPNTNKPLHLGHMRNILLGYSVAELLKANSRTVKKVNLVNDRGIHICKSMVAWQLVGNNETPATSGLKGDHLVGKYYVAFDQLHKEQVKSLVDAGVPEEEAVKKTPVMLQAQQMLRNWEAGDPDTLSLWRMMNDWVYEGFHKTYGLLGVDFDETSYESQTYLLGKEIVHEGLEKGAFYKKEDGSVWVDLTADGLDHKLLLRGDGTSVYITQDIGTAKQRYEKYHFSQLIYVVGNEQDYHFKVLRLVLKKLGYEWWDKLHHLSYAMVDLPSGKMKSREGTVVDADDLMQSMFEEAERTTLELGKVNDLSPDEQTELHKKVGLGALKYFILKVDPEKRMLFNPSESIDFNGHTGPFIQYTYARIRSLMRKAEGFHEFSGFLSFDCAGYSYLNPKERDLIKGILDFSFQCRIAGDRLSPAVLANYAYDMAKLFNQFYHEHPVVDSSSPEATLFRLHICYHCAEVLQRAMAILGIGMPERM